MSPSREIEDATEILKSVSGTNRLLMHVSCILIAE